MSGSLYEMNSTGYLIRGQGYITSLDDIMKSLSAPINPHTDLHSLSDIAEVQMSPDLHDWGSLMRSAKEKGLRHCCGQVRGKREGRD